MKKRLRNNRHAVSMSAGIVLSLFLWMPASVSAEGSARTHDPGHSGSGVSVDFAVTGKIRDENGSPIPGANVLLKGTTMGTTSDAEGGYSLVLPSEQGTLVFSFIGFATQEVEVNGRSVIDITLISDTKTLSEVVVTGYGSQSKREITGAVSTVDSKELLSAPATNLAQAMQGRVPGVVVGNENSPGGGVMVRIRGYGNTVSTCLESRRYPAAPRSGLRLRC